MRTTIWQTMMTAMGAGLLLASCAPAANPTPKPEAPPKVETPAVKPNPSPTAPSPTAKPAAQQPKSGGILTVAHFADPRSYDPIQEQSLGEMAPVIPAYSGVVQHDPLEPTRVIGDLAERWDMSADGMSYTFHLYKNVRWHDGTPLSSEDARFSLELVRKPPKGIVSPKSEWLTAVDRIETPDKDTLRITVEYPSPSLLHNLGDGRMVVIPKHVFEAKGSMKRDIVGTGPFKFKSHNTGSSFNVVKNPDYFVKGRPYLDGITWYIMADLGTRFAAIRTQRVQVTPFSAQGITPSQAELLKREMGDKVTVNKYSGLAYLGVYAK